MKYPKILRSIKATLTKGIAAENPPCAFQAAAASAIALDGLDHVVAAGGLESALLAEDGAESELVEAHHRDDGAARQIGDESPVAHCESLGFRAQGSGETLGESPSECGERAADRSKVGGGPLLGPDD